MPRLRRVSWQEPGWTRRRCGRGFRYLDEQGASLAPADLARVRALVIPPAWTEVWICSYDRGHLQAVGIDEAGRRQYLYHPAWREQRDAEKFDRVATLGLKLPGLRRRLVRELRAEPGDEEVERRRVLAAAVRLIDLGCFRPGSESSAEEFGSHGLTTVERRHVRRHQGDLVFEFVGKSGVEHEVLVDDPDVVSVLTTITRGRAGSSRVLASKVDGRWRPLTPGEVNDRVRELTGLDVTAKDFRTWHATVTVAVALATAPPATSVAARGRRVRAALVEAAELLGNTPAVARSSYVDPRVLELYDEGVVLDPVPSGPNAIDRAVAALLTE
ncbi:DNA topoisomerase IB [Nocardioides humilatus]|uniref:DNA topoisomerase n=1 Tax=Nocardioides humilatus TaxID=2607660 RepID=A0A5B1LEX1_9ACTN|nr:DNA topoisomerase IB [Nocardioides humilatus]KAA1419271.1 DNA topoisomerase IB [Nocardioides humilatus]